MFKPKGMKLLSRWSFVYSQKGQHIAWRSEYHMVQHRMWWQSSWKMLMVLPCLLNNARSSFVEPFGMEYVQSITEHLVVVLLSGIKAWDQHSRRGEGERIPWRRVIPHLHNQATVAEWYFGFQSGQHDGEMHVKIQLFQPGMVSIEVEVLILVSTSESCGQYKTIVFVYLWIWQWEGVKIGIDSRGYHLGSRVGCRYLRWEWQI